MTLRAPPHPGIFSVAITAHLSNRAERFQWPVQPVPCFYRNKPGCCHNR